MSKLSPRDREAQLTGLMVRLLRAVRDWKQEELSRRSGIQRALISQYEREEQIPSTAQLERLAAAAGLPVPLVEGFARTALERLGDVARSVQFPREQNREEHEVPEPSLADAVGRRVASVLEPILTSHFPDEENAGEQAEVGSRVRPS